MTNTDPAVLCYEVLRTRSQGGYWNLAIHIRLMEREPLAEVLAGCVDNRADYGGGMETATKIGRQVSDLIRAGYSDRYDFRTYGSEKMAVSIDLLEYYPEKNGHEGQPHYCTPSLSTGTDYATIKSGAAFLEKMGKAIEKARAKERARESKERDSYCYSPDPYPVSSETFQPREVVEYLERVGAVRIETVKDLSDAWNSWDSMRVPAKSDLPVMFPMPVESVKVAA